MLPLFLIKTHFHNIYSREFDLSVITSHLANLNEGSRAFYVPQEIKFLIIWDSVCHNDMQKVQTNFIIKF